MKLEEAIKQKKFGNEFEKAVVNILYTASWLEGINIRRLKPHDISPQQYNVLRILRGSHPNPVMLGEITERMIDKNSNATRLVEKLRLKGFLKRDICKTNRRQVDITITPKGLSLLDALDVHIDEWQNEHLKIKKSEVQQLNELLDKLRG
jgi:DNA-binding MarR family transcriptional regulator